MKIKYNQKFLEQAEKIFTALTYQIRYEKGSFHAGYCLLSGQKIIVINKYFTLEGRINVLIEILKKIEIPENILEDEDREWVNGIIPIQNTLSL